jgi:hypothetical protein
MAKLKSAVPLVVPAQATCGRDAMRAADARAGGAKRQTERGLARGERGDFGAVQLVDALLVDDHVADLTR